MSDNHLDVAIVGSGLAGLSAAEELQKKGFKIAIFEADSRIGGRVHTFQDLGFPLDAGASWIEGIKGNPLFDLVLKNKIKVKKSSLYNSIVFDKQGNKISELQLWKILRIYKKLIPRTVEKARQLPHDLPAWDVMKEVLERELKFPPDDPLLQWWLSLQEMIIGENYTNLSAKHFDDDFELPGAHVILPQGFISIADVLARDKEIHTHTPIKEIHAHSDGVSLTDGQTTWKAKTALVTVSIGILQAKKISFSPPLEKWRIQALNQLKMGVMNKVFIRYPARFWPPRWELVGLFPRQRLEIPIFVNMFSYVKEPILIGHLAGDQARELESLSDEEIGNIVHSQMELLFGPYIPKPTGVYVTRWNSHPYHLGSYSCVPVGGESEARRQLTAPFRQRVFFAGEALDILYPGTAHGAMRSGFRAAGEIEKFLLQSKEKSIKNNEKVSK